MSPTQREQCGSGLLGDRGVVEEEETGEGPCLFWSRDFAEGEILLF